ncbi:hypothetical protein [Streptomyces chartreusis]|uniref:hypothetical protein n=1 Tax=Streptomyces chartreusis TaxID=1969 RepID=UPI002E197906
MDGNLYFEHSQKLRRNKRLDNPYVGALEARRWKNLDVVFSPEMKDNTHDSGVSLGRHHLISYADLKTFWDSIVRNKFGTMNQDAGGVKAEFKRLLELILRRMTPQSTRLEPHLQNNARNYVSRILDYRHVNAAQEPPGQHEVLRLFVWLPGNIFIGPHTDHRNDNVGEKFERNAKRAAGSEAYGWASDAHASIHGCSNLQYAEGYANAVRQWDFFALDALRKLCRLASYRSSASVAESDWDRDWNRNSAPRQYTPCYFRLDKGRRQERTADTLREVAV